MTIGALGVQRWRSAPGFARAASPRRAPGLALWVAFVALEVAIVGLLRAGSLGTWLPGAAVLLACGALVGAIFAEASWGATSDPRTVVGPLYAADLVGGCAGALGASLFVLPLLGLAPAAAIMGFVAAWALLLA